MPIAWLLLALLALLATGCPEQEPVVRAQAREVVRVQPAAMQPALPMQQPSMAGAGEPALASPDPVERELAVLEFEGDLAELAPLASGDASTDVRRAAVQRLAEGERPIERAALRRALDDPDPGVASEAILALAALDDAAAIPALERLRSHPDAELRALAEDALGALARD